MFNKLKINEDFNFTKLIFENTRSRIDMINNFLLEVTVHQHLFTATGR